MEKQDIGLMAVKHAEAKKCLVLLPQRWGAKSSFGWMARIRRLVRDYERLAESLIGLPFVAIGRLMLRKILPMLGTNS